MFGADTARTSGKVGVDAFDVPGDELVCLCVKRRLIRLGSALKADDAAEAVGVEGGFAKNFCQPPLRRASRLLHLPETILRVHPSQGAIEVGFRLGIDVGNAVFVAQNFDGLVKARGLYRAVQFRCSPLHPPPVEVKKERGAQKHQNQQNDEQRNHNRWNGHSILYGIVLGVQKE